jgi:hypothetical protein
MQPDQIDPGVVYSHDFGPEATWAGQSLVVKLPTIMKQPAQSANIIGPGVLGILEGDDSTTQVQINYAYSYDGVHWTAPQSSNFYGLDGGGGSLQAINVLGYFNDDFRMPCMYVKVWPSLIAGTVPTDFHLGFTLPVYSQ